MLTLKLPLPWSPITEENIECSKSLNLKKYMKILIPFVPVHFSLTVFSSHDQSTFAHSHWLFKYPWNIQHISKKDFKIVKKISNLKFDQTHLDFMSWHIFK